MRILLQGVIFKRVDYSSDRLTLMDGAKPSSVLLSDINGLLQTISPIGSDLTHRIKSTAVNPQKYEEFVLHSANIHAVVTFSLPNLKKNQHFLRFRFLFIIKSDGRIFFFLVVMIR